MSDYSDDTADETGEGKISALNILHEIGIRLVPEKPTSAMCQVGSMIGDIDVETVRRVYHAMLVAASEASLHGDNVLN